MLASFAFQEKDALFLVESIDAEGEFALGLVRRTFDETLQQLADGEVTVHWYQRISRNHSWGRQPGFKLCMRRAGGKACRPKPYVELVYPRKASFPFLSFLPVNLARILRSLSYLRTAWHICAPL
eukprot:2323970-Pleurochrysis_carterae.AAC.1